MFVRRSSRGPEMCQFNFFSLICRTAERREIESEKASGKVLGNVVDKGRGIAELKHTVWVADCCITLSFLER